MEPRYNDVPRDRQHYIVLSGYRFKRIPNTTILRLKQSKLSSYRGIFHLFLEHGGKFAVRLSGKQRNKGIGLEIPATYTFQLHRKLFGSRLKRLPFLSSRVMIGFYRYTCIGVNFKFGLQDCDRYIGDIVIPWIVKPGYCSIHLL